MRYDVAIIGGGIVGAATFYKMQKAYPNLKMILIEKEDLLADHQTGHNSGVIHSGLYYKPGSLKAENCIKGRRELVAFAQEHNIPHDVCGKVVVATDPSELPNMEKVYQTGLQNEIEGIKWITPEEVKEREPFVECIAGILVPCTGIIDFRAATAKMVELALAINPESVLKLKHEVRDIVKNGETSTIKTSNGDFEAEYLVFCAGLQADRLAKKDGVKLKEKVVGFRGDYYELTESGHHKVKHLIYPVPNPDFPFLGVHFTLTLDGKVKIGPTAIPVIGREQYSLFEGWSLSDIGQAITATKALIQGQSHQFGEILKSELPKLRERSLVR